MGKRIVLLLVAVVALAVLSAGCGGGDGDETAAAAADGGSLTKSQYVQRATALCQAERRRISAELDAFDGSPAEAMEEVILSGFRTQYEGLRKLTPPSGEEDFLDLMLSKLSISLEDGEEDLARFFRIKASAYSEFAEGSLMTEEFGIKGCGSLATSPRAVYASF